MTDRPSDSDDNSQMSLTFPFIIADGEKWKENNSRTYALYTMDTEQIRADGVRCDGVGWSNSKRYSVIFKTWLVGKLLFLILLFYFYSNVWLNFIYANVRIEYVLFNWEIDCAYDISICIQMSLFSWRNSDFPHAHTHTPTTIGITVYFSLSKQFIDFEICKHSISHSRRSRLTCTDQHQHQHMRQHARKTLQFLTKCNECNNYTSILFKARSWLIQNYTRDQVLIT